MQHHRRRPDTNVSAPKDAPAWYAAVAVCECNHATLQGMAGNIIHAIATTNAIIAGFIVIEAIKVLAGAQDACKVRPHCLPPGLIATVTLVPLLFCGHECWQPVLHTMLLYGVVWCCIMPSINC